MICIRQKPIPIPRKRGVLRDAWLRAPPLHLMHAQTRPEKGALDNRPHMRVGKIVRAGASAWAQRVHDFATRLGCAQRVCPPYD